jgi:hypothetical protein
MKIYINNINNINKNSKNIYFRNAIYFTATLNVGLPGSPRTCICTHQIERLMLERTCRVAPLLAHL